MDYIKLKIKFVLGCIFWAYIYFCIYCGMISLFPGLEIYQFGTKYFGWMLSLLITITAFEGYRSWKNTFLGNRATFQNVLAFILGTGDGINRDRLIFF